MNKFEIAYIIFGHMLCLSIGIYGLVKKIKPKETELSNGGWIAIGLAPFANTFFVSLLLFMGFICLVGVQYDRLISKIESR